MKFTSIILFVACFYLANGKGNYDFPSAPIIPLPKPVDVLVKPAGHDKGVEEHVADTDHDSAYKFQEVSHSNPIDGSEKVVKEEAKDETKDSQYNFVARDKELIPGVKETAISEDSKDKDHSSYYKFAAYDRAIPALYKTYYPAYYPAFPIVSPYDNGGYGGINMGGYGGINMGGYGGGNMRGYGGGNMGGFVGGNMGGYGGGNIGGYSSIIGGYGGGYGGYGSPYIGLGNVLGGLGNSLGGQENSLYGLENSLGSNYHSDNSYDGYGNLNKNVLISDPIFPSINNIPSSSSIYYKPTSHNTMKKVNFDQSYDAPPYE